MKQIKNKILRTINNKKARKAILCTIIALFSVFWFIKNRDIFISNLNLARNGFGFIEKYKYWKPDISIGNQLMSTFEAGFFITIIRLIISMMISPVTLSLVIVIITIGFLKHLIVFRKVTFKNDRAEKRSRTLLYIPRIILKSIYFVYDLIVIYPVTYIFKYLTKRDANRKLIFINHLIFLIAAYLFYSGRVFNLLVDIIQLLKAYISMIVLNFNPMSTFISELRYPVIRLVYYVFEKLTPFRIIIIALVSYSLISVHFAKIKKSKMIKNVGKVISKIIGVITAIFGHVGSGKTKTLVAMARAQEQLNWDLFRKEMYRVEAQYPELDWTLVRNQFGKNYANGLITSSRGSVKFIMNIIESEFGKDVWNRTYNDFKPSPRRFKEDIRLYSTAQFKLVQKTLIHSNIPIESTGPTPELINQVRNFGQRKGDFIYFDKPIFSNIFHFDNFRLPGKSISKKIVRSVAEGDIIVITEADKNYSSFNVKTLLESGLDKVLSTIRHRLSFSFFPAGKILWDYQTDTSIWRQARSKGDAGWEIKKSRNRSPFLIKPIAFLTEKKFEKLEKNKYKILENRNNSDVFLKRINKALSRWLIIKNYFNQFNYTSIDFQIATTDGIVLGKQRLNISDDVHSYYDSVIFAENERELEKQNTHFPKSFKNKTMSKSEMKEQFSEHFDEQYLFDDEEVRARDYAYGRKDDESEEDKYNYYADRVENENLTEAQRKYARRWLKENGGEEWS